MMLREVDKLHLLALSKLRGVGPATLEKLARVPSLAEHSIDELSVLSSALKKALTGPVSWSESLQAARKDLDQADKMQARILCSLESAYPTLLRGTPDRPFFLFVRGTLHIEQEKSLAIIGTREPTENGRTICKRLTEFFVTQNWSVVSGLALGLDAVAHASAVATRGHTIAVLAHGLQTVAPKQHDRLAREILDSGGALVTEYGFGVEPSRHNFVKRDRIQAGLAQAVVMVQSDLHGGSLHASRAALEYGRLLAVPCPTARDLEKKEPKISANALLASGEDAARMELLRCKPADLSRLVILKGREDYPLLEDRIDQRPSSGLIEQNSLLP
ncbi:DNA-processing protein DprA [Solimonas sp. SE-A11]|uniref:DNA-processing protein DprA n=1 Tax=Solimonas sp. SE-A11 TaxID=3054954 RepID=UPI00259CF13A|nr:DNA-processing protein DprA [Solimonas sp. SE-A11]MDM4772866.1 DNA-processing protein DprA [Solimonas sp. SE-A11]